jgi:hypothetical protein
MENETVILLDKIQLATGETLEDIAATIGKSRPYLNNVKLKNGSKTIDALLRKHYKEILQNDTTGTVNLHVTETELLQAMIENIAAVRARTTVLVPIVKQLEAERVQRLRPDDLGIHQKISVLIDEQIEIEMQKILLLIEQRFLKK